jgi:Kef-type K+ transport system membrane component KefB
MDAQTEGSRHAGTFLTGAAIAQCLVVPYLLLAGTMAAEMSGVLSGVMLSIGVLTAVATAFLFRRRRWAWRVSSALAALAFVTGVVVMFELPPVGALHAIGSALILGALWAGRPALPSGSAPGST